MFAPKIMRIMAKYLTPNCVFPILEEACAELELSI